MTLNNGVQMPVLGLGVFLSPPEQTAAAVETALRTGYRLIDTAEAYLNERNVGQGMRSSGVARENVFVTTKLWVSQYGYDSALRAFDRSLDRLGLDYLDLYLLHWPVPSDFGATVAAYRAAERLLADGRVRAIGVSNFLPRHLDALAKQTQVPPAVNQVELNPFYTQEAVREANARTGTVTQAWSPIGGVYGRNPNAVTNGADSPLSHPVIRGLAAKYDKTPAQVVLRWHLDHGFSAIPKSVRAGRIRENYGVSGFTLEPGEIARVDELDTGTRAGSDPETFTAASYQVDVDSQ
jgi:diketogulonate reductase-like aldo/keto reductase